MANLAVTDQEIHPYLGKPVRASLADGRILAGTLHADDRHGHGHGHVHYLIVSAPLREDSEKVVEMIHGAQAFVAIEDAANDPAARE